MTPLEIYRDILFDIVADTIKEGRYCKLCKHYGNEDRKAVYCKSPSVYGCPAVDQAVTVIEGDIFVQRRIADRDWLAE